MSSKPWLIWIGAAMLAVVIALWAALPGSAQCGEDFTHSSCITCHQTQAPVYAEGEWHIIHARKDCCASCHGGNCTAMEKELAHQGMVARPLEDIYTNCYACHPEDYALRADRFAAILGVPVHSSSTPTPMPTCPPVTNKMVILADTPTPAPPGSPGWMLMIGAALALSLLAGLWLLGNHLKIQGAKT
jgi:hypothetical protein